MTHDSTPLLDWTRRLAAIAQTGLTFASGVYDRERYLELQRLAAEMAAHPNGEADSVEDVFASERGYATPKVICRAAVFDADERVLMVREAADGRWTVPGGWIEVGDSPAGAAEREVWEETGYEVRAVKLAGLYDKLRHDHPPTPHHSYLLFFVCELLGGQARTSTETTAVEWFPIGELPELSVTRATRWQIERMLQHHRDVTSPTDFDQS